MTLSKISNKLLKECLCSLRQRVERALRRRAECRLSQTSVWFLLCLVFAYSLGACFAPFAYASASMNKYEEFLMTFDREDRNKALLLINEVLAKNNKNSYYVCERARLYLAMNRLADARTECTKALAIDPKNLQARRTRSYCFFMMKDYKKGLDDINIALKDETPYPVDMNFTGDYENRAKALLLLGKKNEAKKDERYIAADRFLRQAIQAREGAGVEKAIACCDQALALDSTSL